MAWSLKGADNMARIRAIKANGEQVREHCIASFKTPPAIKLDQEVEKELVRVKEKMLSKEDFNNLPLLRGKCSLTRIALKGLQEKMIV